MNHRIGKDMDGAGRRGEEIEENGQVMVHLETLLEVDTMLVVGTTAIITLIILHTTGGYHIRAREAVH